MNNKGRSPGDIYSLVANLDDKEEIGEEDIYAFLEEPDNIIISFGQNITGYSRSEIIKNSLSTSNIYKDDKGNKYIQIVGRHLIKAENLEFIEDENFSIFDMCTLIDVVLVTNLESGARQKRSYYEIKAYTIDEYKKL